MEFNIADLFESLVDVAPDRTALVSGAHRLTFAELDARANRFAHALQGLGVGAGDHVGLYLYNGAEFIESMLGAFKIRAVPVNINYRYVEEELAYLFSNADLVVLFAQRELLPRALAVSGRVPTLHTIVAVDDGSEFDALGVKSTAYEALLAGGSPARGFSDR